ncbi:MAG: PIN domain-containing protein [Patescibacteria group bacterium]
MKNLYADANVLISFLTKRIPSQYLEAEKMFVDARGKNMKVILIPEVILETAYVLQSRYGVSRQDIHDSLTEIFNTQVVEVKHKDIIIRALEILKEINVDLSDIYLYLTAKNDNAEVFSFDEDFEKLKRRF